MDKNNNITKNSFSINQQDYIRLTSTYIPNSKILLKNCGVPFGASVTFFPFTERENDIKKYEISNNYERLMCHNCRAYRHPEPLEDWDLQCPICEYYSSDDGFSDGGEVDEKENKKENVFGNETIYDMYVGEEMEEFTFVFIINEFCVEGIEVLCDVLRYCVENEQLSQDENCNICFVSFNDKFINFYNINERNGFQMFTISGNESFLPSTLTNLTIQVTDEKKNIILSFIDTLENQLIEKANTKNMKKNNFDILVNSLECGVKMITKAGKILLFTTSIEENEKKPTSRDNNKKERDTKVEKLFDFDHLSCDIFQISLKGKNHNLDIFTDIINRSNGTLLYINESNKEEYYSLCYSQIIKSLTSFRHTNYYAVIAKGQGLVTSYVLSHWNDKDLICPNLNVGQSITLLFDLNCNDNHSLSKYYLFLNFQFHIYYHYKRKSYIRVINGKIKLTPSLDIFYKHLDIELSNVLIAKLFVKLIEKTSDVESSFANINQIYYSNCFPTIKDLKLSELLTQMLLCFLGIMKNRTFCNEEAKKKININTYNMSLFKIKRGSVDEVMNIILPKLYDITNVLNGTDNFENISFSPLPLTKSSIKPDRIYLLDNGYVLDIHFTYGDNIEHKIKIFFGNDVSFQVAGTNKYTEKMVFDENSNKNRYEIVKCKEIIETIRKTKNYHPKVLFSFEGGVSEAILKECLIQDFNCPWFNYSYTEYYKKI